MKDKYALQAFEVEDIHTRKNFTYVYNPYDQSVEMYDTSRDVGRKLIGRKNKEFHEDCETAYEFYQHLYKKSFEIDPDRPIVFLGYVNPFSIQPLAEMEDWDESKNIENYKEIITRLDWIHKFFSSSISDNYIKELVQKDTYIAGGAIASLIHYDRPKDYDLFFTNKESMNKVIQYFVNQHNIRFAGTNKKNKINTIIDENGKIKLLQSREFVVSDDEDNKEMNPVVFSSRAISFPNRIQLIIDADDEETKTYHRFDFVHSMSNYVPKDNTLNVPEYVLRVIENNELVYNIQGTNPVGSARRLLRFIERGWKISRKEHNKLLRNVSELKIEQSELWDEEYVF